MRLQSLRGFAPTAAFVAGGCLLLGVLVFIFGPPAFANNPGLEAPLAVVMILALACWPAALTVVGADLEWLEHPATHTGRMQAALVAAVIAMFMPPLVGLVAFLATNTNLPSVPAGVLGFALAVFLIIQNREARKAKLLHGVLPWIGMVAGGAFAVSGLGWLLSLASPLGYGLAFLGLIAGGLCCLFWSVWLGVVLRRAQRLPEIVPAGA